jgi:RNA recognition motif-containing protein
MAKRIFVGNLPFSATEDALRSIFAQHGDVSSVDIVKDRMTNRSRGFGFVEMATDEAAAAAIAGLNQYVLDGRPLTVKEALERGEGGPRRDRDFGGFGGGGGGGFGRPRSGGGGGRGGPRRDDRPPRPRW